MTQYLLVDRRGGGEGRREGEEGRGGGEARMISGGGGIARSHA